jgi:hypothetical protein
MRGIVAGHLGRFGGVCCHIKRSVSQMRPKDGPPFTESWRHNFAIEDYRRTGRVTLRIIAIATEIVSEI